MTGPTVCYSCHGTRAKTDDTGIRKDQAIAILTAADFLTQKYQLAGRYEVVQLADTTKCSSAQANCELEPGHRTGPDHAKSLGTTQAIGTPPVQTLRSSSIFWGSQWLATSA